MDGATLRLSLGEPDASARIDGVLSIDLEPGWKTYWIDPGPVGLAPTFDTSGANGLSDFRFDYPAPVRFREGDQVSVGYDAPVLIPFSARVEGSGAVRAEMELTIGLCRDLCIPVRERLAAKPNGSLSVRAEILAARRLLPEPADPNRIELTFDGKLLHARVDALPGDGMADLFPVAREGWRIGQPDDAPTRRDGVWIATFPADLRTPADGSSLPSLDLVLTSGERARSLHHVPVSCDPACSLPPSAKAQP